MATATSNDVTQSLFITGLQNIHGVENQALALMDRQLDHLENYPEVSDMLRKHRAETEEQIKRVDAILAEFDADPSKLKDIFLSISGNMAALAHLPAPDEILKNSFANYAFENFEIASYTSLLTLADAAGVGNLAAPLELSLGEEQRMAAWVLESLPALTTKYVARRQAGETASH